MLRFTWIALLIAMVVAGTGCGGGISAQSSTLSPPSSAPSIISISPRSAVAGTPDLPLTIMGSNFTGTTHNIRRPVWTVNGSNTNLAKTPVSDTQLTAVIPAALLSSAVTAQVFIEYGDPMGDVPLSKSNSVSFSVIPPVPGVASIFPPAATLGLRSSRQFAANIDGSSSVTWSVAEGVSGGSITDAGLYTPNNLGTFHVVAASTTNPSLSAIATVSVVEAGFQETGSMHVARNNHSATLLQDGRALIVGGADASAELFDPASGTFSITGSMTTPRSGATVTALATGKLLIAGGFGQGTSFLPILSTAELYDPSTGTFTATGNMVVPRVRHTATLLDDGRVLIAGGTFSSGGGGAAVASAELYDPATGTFAPTGGMHTDRAEHTATLLANGEVLIAGGWNGHRADAADDPPWDPLFAELYKSASQTFDVADSMSTTRIGHVAVRLADGKVLMLGGVPGLQNIHEQPPDPQYAEVYDPVAGFFSALPGLTLSRQGYTATLLTNGKVLLVGGEHLGTVVRTAELLEPGNGSLSATGELVTARKGHTATRLNDGRVLVTGGVDSNGNALALAELYM